MNFHELNMPNFLLQLNQYVVLLLNDRFHLAIQLNYCDQNVSNTISYDPSEVEGIVDWLLANWDTYVGVSFLYRNDPSKTAEDLGYTYLPQEVVTKEVYDEYVATLGIVDFGNTDSFEELSEDECAGGVCPIK